MNNGMKTPTLFIVVDDDLVSNMLCRIIIKSAVNDSEIKTFTLPKKGFSYIEKSYVTTNGQIPTVLLLDINMPGLNGWQFLDCFEKLAEKIRTQIEIYMLSSSMNPKEMERAKSHPQVVDYIVKPLTIKVVTEIILKANR